MSENRLQYETSPYLLQHKDNPVHWWAWGPEALAEAKRTGKPILLSVGYAACHWCHVMAHESFEDPGTAEVMNEFFINIKVDREERPDIDAIYMGALQPVVSTVAGLLADGGLLAFSLEKLAGDDDFRLQPSRRYAHSENYVRRLLEQNGLTLLSLDERALRQDRGEPVAGMIVVAGR